MLVEWLKWGALLMIAGILSDMASELKLLRQEIAAQKSWKKYMEDDGK